MLSKDYIKNRAKRSSKYLSYMIKWLLCSLFIGGICGAAGVLFHYCVDYASEIRMQFPLIICALPLAGVMIVLLYRACKMQNDKGTNTVISSIRSGEKVPILMAPLILIGTALTHLCGGSSGREGAALQIGGSIGSFCGRILRLKERDAYIMVMCGMSAVFSAVFGTPLTAAVFSIEMICVGRMYYNAFLPCLLSAVFAHSIAQAANMSSTSFIIKVIPEFTYPLLFKIIILAALCALLSSLFIILMHRYSSLAAKYISNPYIRAAVGGFIVVAATFLLGTNDYNSVGMPVIKSAIEQGLAHPEAFILKLLLTVITLGSGFKGGEILPSFFIGSTFGAFAASFLNVEPSFCAAIGLIAVFCGVVNCPLASIVLSVELFGSGGFILFAVAAAVSYIVSGYYSLYSSQQIINSKLSETYEEESTTV